MSADPALAQILSLGLAAMDYRETATRGDWRRYAKWNRPAYYVLPNGQLWWSDLHKTFPDYEEKGPFLDQIFDLGVKVDASIERAFRPSLNADAMLDELGK